MSSKIKSIKIVLVVYILLSIVGCATVYLDLSTIEKNVLLTDRLGKPFTVIKHFSCERKAYFVLLGFIKISNPDFNEAIRTELSEAHGDAAIHTTIEVEYDVVDTVVPYGIGAAGWALMGPIGLNLSYVLTMQTYRIQGDVIRYLP